MGKVTGTTVKPVIQTSVHILYYLYKDVWISQIGDEFSLRQDKNNVHDRYAVAIVVNDDIVDHLPRDFSKVVYYFLKKNSSVATGVIDRPRHRSTVDSKGLEILCTVDPH